MGNTVLATEAIERAVYPFMGEKRQIEDVQAARAALEKAYRDVGFGSVGVDIPEQRVDAGVVRLQVVEARIVRTRVTGSRYFSQGYILDQVPSAAEGGVPHFPTLQAELAKVNRTSDRRVTPLLRPGREPGTTEFDLVVQDQLPLHGSIELNNRASPNTSSTRLQASLRYDNVLQLDHSLALQLQVSPEEPREVQVLGASYTVPAGEAGRDSWLFSLIQSNSEVAAGVDSTTVFGKGRIWGLRRTHTLLLREREYHLMTLGVDLKDFDETIEAEPGNGFSTPLRYLPLSANYLAILEDAAGRWQWGAGVSLGIRGLVNEESEFADKRFGATGGYSILKFDASREQGLGATGVRAWLRLDGQLTGQPLVANEQFVVGGVDSVRGYLESAAVGDSGLRGSFELRSGPLPNLGWSALGTVTAHAFLEGAATEIRQPLPGQTSRFRLMSAGFGMRVASAAFGRLAVDLGWPMRTLGATQRGDLRVHASGALEF
ncbi:MAG: ShlB/FhaC/HecB family hemolysin secretion/activation protein [Chitinophagaceae bacterium]|nr:ShlB/FhaC/HecB family hemolysin secretion/activation protein [Rubrivivax sp.]